MSDMKIWLMRQDVLTIVIAVISFLLSCVMLWYDDFSPNKLVFFGLLIVFKYITMNPDASSKDIGELLLALKGYTGSKDLKESFSRILDSMREASKNQELVRDEIRRQKAENRSNRRDIPYVGDDNGIGQT